MCLCVHILLGPIIRAEVGEVLHITFLNKASRPYSIKPHGVKTLPQNPTPVLPGMEFISQSQFAPLLYKYILILLLL